MPRSKKLDGELADFRQLPLNPSGESVEALFALAPPLRPNKGLAAAGGLGSCFFVQIILVGHESLLSPPQRKLVPPTLCRQEILFGSTTLYVTNPIKRTTDQNPDRSSKKLHTALIIETLRRSLRVRSHGRPPAGYEIFVCASLTGAHSCRFTSNLLSPASCVTQPKGHHLCDPSFQFDFAHHKRQTYTNWRRGTTLRLSFT